MSKVRDIATEAALSMRIHKLERRVCGNCNHHMKTSSCPREKAGQKPSINEQGCDDFVQDGHTAALIARYKAELAEIAV